MDTIFIRFVVTLIFAGLGAGGMYLYASQSGSSPTECTVNRITPILIGDESPEHLQSMVCVPSRVIFPLLGIVSCAVKQPEAPDDTISSNPCKDLENGLKSCTDENTGADNAN